MTTTLEQPATQTKQVTLTFPEGQFTTAQVAQINNLAPLKTAIAMKRAFLAGNIYKVGKQSHTGRGRNKVLYSTTPTVG